MELRKSDAMVGFEVFTTKMIKLEKGFLMIGMLLVLLGLL